MRPQPIELAFKGAREYLHGSDVYDAAVDQLRREFPGIDGRCRYSFHKMARKPLASVISGPKMSPVDGIVASMHITGGENEVAIWFVERQGEIIRRYDYDEDAVVKHCAVFNRCISSNAFPNNSPIEVIIAMTKKLHNTLFPLTAGKWIFARLDLNRILRRADKDGLLAVTYISGDNGPMTRSEIATANEFLGSIYFYRSRSN